MKFLICTLAVLGAAQAGLLPHVDHHDQFDHHDLHHDFVDADVHHSDGIHLGHSSAVVIDGAEHPHPVYHHHDEHVGHLDVHHTDVHAPAAKIVHHDAIHQVEPVHHVTKVVHHEPHHFLHYTNPVVDHHVVHHNAHVDEHVHAADLHHSDLHHGYGHGYVHHHSAPLVHHHHHSHAALVHKVYPAHLDTHSPANILAFAKHHLHGKYGKVRITETHY
ncbi:histidine-rich glycoprotein [Scaptodrosophila lebanonensis]|uniref:Histidine-rich glycoprotein n=1 Tax=Drosophila lebanonensis TaxID=7225 RepID=A0A6J2T5N5_DROLE|nr:histidine-rich glycoprotein [Scaptodrosophila lebanonensis]